MKESVTAVLIASTASECWDVYIRGAPFSVNDVVARKYVMTWVKIAVYSSKPAAGAAYAPHLPERHINKCRIDFNSLSRQQNVTYSKLTSF